MITCNSGDLCVSYATPARLRGIQARVAGLPLNNLGVVMKILSQPENKTKCVDSYRTIAYYIT